MGALVATFQAAGITLTALPNGRLRAAPAGRLTDALRASIRDQKAAILAELAAANDDCAESAVEARRQRVIALLEQYLDWYYAVVVETEAEPDAVVVHIGIRGQARGEILIDKARYDPAEFMRCLDRVSERQVRR